MLDLMPTLHPTLRALMRETPAPVAETPIPTWHEEAKQLIDTHLMSMGIPHDCLPYCTYTLPDIPYGSATVAVHFHYPAFAPIGCKVHLLGDGVRYHGTRHLVRDTSPTPAPFIVASATLKKNSEREWETRWVWVAHDLNAASALAQALRISADHMEGYWHCIAQQDWRNSPDCQELNLTFTEE